MTLRAVAVFLVLMAAACAAPVPTPTNTAPPTAAPSPTAPAALRVDAIATVTTDLLQRWVDPAHKSRDPKRLPPIALGARVLLVDGPMTVDGTTYWQVFGGPFADYSDPLGWAPAMDPGGTAALTPFAPSCPPAADVIAAQLAGLDRFEPLACYANGELVLHGTVKCSTVVGDGILAGLMLSSTTTCGLDGLLALFGDLGGLFESAQIHPDVPPTFEIRGHFDDAGAQHCYGTPFGTPLNGSRTPGDPGAIQECRLFFVVTAAQELTN
jgi:hypothetical protein